MKRLALRKSHAVFLGVLASSVLRAQTNTNVATAADITLGHYALSRIGPGATTMWFSVSVSPGRSYCAEVSHQGGFSGYTQDHSDTVLDVYKSDTTTVVAHNDDATDEPLRRNYSRACWIVPAVTSTEQFVLLTPFSATLGAAHPVQLRVLETTLFCPWFFIAGDYNAFSLLRNTSQTPMTDVVITWRGLDGSVAGATTISIPAEGGVVLNARDFVNPGNFSNGTIDIAHKGAPGQIQGSTTTLSGTTGLGFDAPFSPRLQ